MLFKNDQLNNSSLKLLIQFKGMERIRLIGDQTNVAAVSAMESRSTLFCIGTCLWNPLSFWTFIATLFSIMSCINSLIWCWYVSDVGICAPVSNAPTGCGRAVENVQFVELQYWMSCEHTWIHSELVNEFLL